MTIFSPSREYAQQLDQRDPLASYREQFVVHDPDLIYLDGNSLGRLPKAVIKRMQKAVEEEWGTDLIRGWNKGWWEAPTRIGEKIASLLGAAEGQVVVGDQTSINLFKLATAALTLHPEKKHIVTDTFNFPSDLYILQGIVKLCFGRAGRGVTKLFESAHRMMTSHPISPRSKLPSMKNRARHAFACHIQERLSLRHGTHHRTRASQRRARVVGLKSFGWRCAYRTRQM